MPTASCPHLNYKINFRKELGSAKLILQCFDTFLVWEYFSRLFCLSVSIVQNCTFPMPFPIYFILRISRNSCKMLTTVYYFEVSINVILKKEYIFRRCNFVSAFSSSPNF